MANGKYILPSDGSTETSIGLVVDPTTVNSTDCSSDEMKENWAKDQQTKLTA